MLLMLPVAVEKEPPQPPLLRGEQSYPLHTEVLDCMIGLSAHYPIESDLEKISQ